MKKLLYTLVLSAFVLGANAQDFSLYQLKTLPQNRQVNPAFMPESNWYIGGGVLPIPLTPPINIDVANSFALKDILDGTGSTTYLDMSDYVETMPEQAGLRVNTQLDILNFGFKVKDKHFFSMQYSARLQVLGLLSKSLMEFAWKGNGHDDFIGDTTRVTGFGANVMAYSTLKLGYTHKYDDKWTFGIAPSLYFGHMYLNTGDTYFDIYTSENFDELSITPSLSMQAAGSEMLILGENRAPGFNPINGFGLGIDLGAHYKVDDNLSVHGSILDFGFIGWNGYNLTNDAEKITFNGVEADNLLGGGDDESNGDNMNGGEEEEGGFMDSLFTSITNNMILDDGDGDTNTLSTTKINTGVPTKIFIGANYEFDKNWGAGVLMRNYFINGVYKFGVSVSGNVKVNNWLSSTLTYSIYNNAYNNIGLGSAVNMGPIQFYVMADNLFGLTQVDYMKNFNIRLGMNIRPTGGRKARKAAQGPKPPKAKKVKGSDDKVKVKEEKGKDKKEKIKIEDENK